MQMLAAEHIGKTYDKHSVLKDINLAVRKGEAIALVGENGCGKSTLIRILSGLTPPSQGRVSAAPGSQCAFVPDRFDKVNMTIPRYLSHMRLLGGAETEEPEPYYGLFSLGDMLDTPMKYLSKGTLQKAAVIQALTSACNIMFLDEPLSGQDTASQYQFARELKKRKAAGMAIVMACHEPFLIEELADVVYQFKEGILVSGESYVFERGRTHCIFLIEPNNADLADELASLGVQMTVLGRLAKIEAPRDTAKALFALFAAQNVRIVKYDETEGVC